MKEDFTRDLLKKNIMEQVLFRLDYAGLLSPENVAETFAKQFGGEYFTKYETTFHNHIELAALDIDSISTNLAIPVKEIQRHEIHRFTVNTFGKDTLVFDIGKYYTVLQVFCREYETIDPYLEFYVQFLNFLKKETPLISFKRFGLRKIGAKLFTEYQQIFNDFERDIFSMPLDEPFEKDKSDILDVINAGSMYKINYRRTIEKGTISEAEGERIGFRVTLDIDGFIEDENMTKIADEGTFEQCIRELNHIFMFSLFKLSVTNNFLNAHRK